MNKQTQELLPLAFGYIKTQENKGELNFIVNTVLLNLIEPLVQLDEKRKIKLDKSIVKQLKKRVI